MGTPQEKTIKELPRKELCWVRAVGFDGEVYHITSAPDRTYYTLYKEVPAGFVRVAKDKTPLSFDQYLAPPEEPAKKPKRVKK